MSKDNVDKIEDGLQEDSIAMQSLHPNSMPAGDDPKSKVEHMKKVIGAMASMENEDLVKWYKKAMDLIGKETSALPSAANSGANQSSIDMKASGAVSSTGPKTADPMPKLDHKNNPLANISVKEDVEEMFNGQDLSEEFKEKATTIFEAAVNARAIVEIARLEEEFETRLSEQVEEITKTLEEQVDAYLDFVVEKWMTDNEVAIESTLRNEIMEEFIEGLKGLFAEHYIDVPEEKIDVVEELAQKVDALESRLNETIVENVELKRNVTESTRRDMVANMSEGLTLLETEKFAALAEGVEFDGDLETYGRKLTHVKEAYFNKKPATRTNLEEETFDDGATTTVHVDPDVNRYVNAISRISKR